MAETAVKSVELDFRIICVKGSRMLRLRRPSSSEGKGGGDQEDVGVSLEPEGFLMVPWKEAASARGKRQVVVVRANESRSFSNPFVPEHKQTVPMKKASKRGTLTAPPNSHPGIDAIS